MQFSVSLFLCELNDQVTLQLAQAGGAQPVTGAQLTRGIFSSYRNMTVKLSPRAIRLDHVELLASFTLALVYFDPQLQASGHSSWFPKLSVWKMSSLVQAKLGASWIGGNSSMAVLVFFFSELFQVVLCFILMGMTKCCNPLSSRQNQFVIMPWIYQSIALGKYLSM